MPTSQQPLYRAVVRDACVRTWRNPFLWPLGFLAGLALTGSAFDILLRYWDTITGQKTSIFFTIGLLVQRLIEHPNGINARLLIPIGGMLILGLIALACLVISVMSQGAMLAAITTEEEHGTMNLRAFFQNGKKHRWSLLLLTLSTRAALVALALLCGVLYRASAYAPTQWLAMLGLAGIGILVLKSYLLISVSLFAAVGIVRFDESVMTALKKGLTLFRTHLLVVIETSILLFFVDALISLAITAGFFALAVPFSLLFAGANLVHAGIGTWLLSSMFVLITVLWVLVIAAAAVVFHYTVWTLLTERMRNEAHTVVAKSTRWISSVRTAMKSV